MHLHHDQHPSSLTELGCAAQLVGDTPAALRHFLAAHRLDPRSQSIYSNIGTSLTYSLDHGPADLKRVYDEFDRAISRPLRDMRPHGNLPDPYRRLRVGYVSPDFRQHAVAYFALPLLEGHDPANVEVFCYYNHRQQDDWTARFRSAASNWVECADMSDEQLAARIRVDQVDILVDLAGHTLDNRLKVFARKPAPVQVTWLGYVTTTGLSAMDYRLTHVNADPVGVEEDYSEALVRLPGSMWCYRPLPAMPPVTSPPFARKGHITFASFNRFSKVSPSVLDVWAGILVRVPDSRLLLCIPEGRVRDEVADRFRRYGVRGGRLSFFAKLPHTQFWQLHHEADIALDPFPFNGGTTTCETLWLGVPLVTCTGGPGAFAPRFASRMGAAMLNSIGLSELVTADESAYADCAVRLAQDPERLQHLRQSLRNRMAASPLMDEPRFAHEVESAYRQMWQAWCRKMIGDRL